MSDYEYREFPKWKYRGKESKVVNSPEEEEELGEGWVDSPADAVAVEEEAVDAEDDDSGDDDDSEGETVPPDEGGEPKPKAPTKRASKKKA